MSVLNAVSTWPSRCFVTHCIQHFLLVLQIFCLRYCFSTQMPGILKQEEYTSIHTNTYTDTSTVTEQGLIRPLTQTLMADPAVFPADLLSLYCAKSVLFFLFKQDFPCWENDSEGNTNQGKSVWGTSSVFHSCPLYSSPLISPFIIVTLYSKTLPHSDSSLPAISSSLSLILSSSAIVLPLNSVGTHRVKCIHGTCGWLPQDT